MPTVYDMFSGAGGMSAGFVAAGFTPLGAFDHDQAACKTWSLNHTGEVTCGDVETFPTSPPGVFRCDVLIGGPPCQGFSQLNPRRAGDRRRSLWEPFLNWAVSLKVQAFVLENVPQIINTPEFGVLSWCAEKAGFHVTANVLQAAHFGVPQYRKRAFVIGCRRGPMPMPSPHPWRPVTVREAFQGIPYVTDTTTMLKSPDGICGSQLHVGRPAVTDGTRARYALVPPGGNRFDVMKAAPHLCPPCWLRKLTGSTDVFGRLQWDEPAHCTIRTEFYKPEKGRYLHPSADRVITHWEAARLQGFPDTFRWSGSRIAIAKQIGNAVPPPLARAVAQQLLSFL